MVDKKAILFTGGSGPGKEIIEELTKNAGYIIAADSGLDLALAYEIEPDLVVGDMDSLEHTDYLNSLSEEKKNIYPEDKDETDTEIGLRVLYEKGYNRVTVIGGGGGRIDHFLGILYLFFKDTYPVEWYTHDYQLICIDRPVLLHGNIGSTVSFFPSSRGKCRMKSSGLKWNLDELTWRVGDGGISNSILETPCKITPVEGRLMLVARLEEELSIE